MSPKDDFPFVLSFYRHQKYGYSKLLILTTEWHLRGLGTGITGSEQAQQGA